MRLIHCKKCGHALVTEDALVERMMGTVHDLNEKARGSSDGRVAKSYLAEAAAVTKMMKGILYNTSELERRRTTCSSELAELVYHVRSNNLVSDEKLEELRTIAKEKAEARNAENQKEIDRIYGAYNAKYSPANKTKADPTAKKAIRKTNKR